MRRLTRLLQLLKRLGTTLYGPLQVAHDGSLAEGLMLSIAELIEDRDLGHAFLGIKYCSISPRCLFDLFTGSLTGYLLSLGSLGVVGRRY